MCCTHSCGLLYKSVTRTGLADQLQVIRSEQRIRKDAQFDPEVTFPYRQVYLPSAITI